MPRIAAYKTPSKERGNNGNGSGWRKDCSLIIVGNRGEKDISHRKRAQKLNELIAMRVARKMRLKELMEKRAGTFC